jgi:hypothetical protein
VPIFPSMAESSTSNKPSDEETPRYVRCRTLHPQRGGGDRGVIVVIVQYGQGRPDVLRVEAREIRDPGPGQVAIEQPEIGFKCIDIVRRNGFLSTEGRSLTSGGEGDATASMLLLGFPNELQFERTLTSSRSQ